MSKIVFFDFFTLNYGGGCEVNFMNYGKWLSRRGVDVAFITSDSRLNKLLCSIIRVVNYKENISEKELADVYAVKKYKRFGLKDILFLTAARKEIKRVFDEADVVYSKNEIFEIFFLRFIFRIKTSKIVFGFHTPILYPNATSLKARFHNVVYKSWVFSWLLGDSRIRHLVLSEADKKLLSDAGKKNVMVIPNPLNTKKFFRQSYEKHPIFTCSYIGRMTEQKGVDTFAKAIDLLSGASEFKRMSFRFVGSGKDESVFKKTSEAYDNCKFFGFASDIVPHYLASDLVVVPSRWETFCYTVAEAQSCGVPVVCTNITGPKDIIVPDITGWLVEVDDAKGLMDKILYAFSIWENNFAEYKEIGNKSRANIISKFDEDIINSQVSQFILGKAL